MKYIFVHIAILLIQIMCYTWKRVVGNIDPPEIEYLHGENE